MVAAAILSRHERPEPRRPNRLKNAGASPPLTPVDLTLADTVVCSSVLCGDQRAAADATARCLSEDGK